MSINQQVLESFLQACTHTFSLSLSLLTNKYLNLMQSRIASMGMIENHQMLYSNGAQGFGPVGQMNDMGPDQIRLCSIPV